MEEVKKSPFLSTPLHVLTFVLTQSLSLSLRFLE